MALTLYELGLSELILRTFLIFIHSSSAVSRTATGMGHLASDHPTDLRLSNG